MKRFIILVTLLILPLAKELSAHELPKNLDLQCKAVGYGFLTLLDSGNLREAYDLLSKKAKEKAPYEEFRSFVANRGFSNGCKRGSPYREYNINLLSYEALASTYNVVWIVYFPVQCPGGRSEFEKLEVSYFETEGCAIRGFRTGPTATKVEEHLDPTSALQALLRRLQGKNHEAIPGRIWGLTELPGPQP